MTPEELLPAVIEKAGLPSARQHLFLCLGPDCCSPEMGQLSWDYLKQQVARLNLQVLRTRAACFRICSQGPILLVYPDGIWYARVTPERLQRILNEHIQLRQPVQEWILHHNPLQSSQTPELPLPGMDH
ncbi:MAG: (2Fe-2S) ferredoxin domain-containing protein [Blastochloris sp.]|nr:(2Fe-2S) ferredoxin domain-containing protein [Blastochloris sp.]